MKFFLLDLKLFPHPPSTIPLFSLLASNCPRHLTRLSQVDETVDMIAPRRWTQRGLFQVLLPQFFRRPRTIAETLGAPKTHKVPLDAHDYHLFITRKQKRMKKHLYLLNTVGIRSRGVTSKQSVWSVATGEWVPRNEMHMTTLLSPTLGPGIANHITRDPSLWHAPNGLLLPEPIKQALDDWAMVIVPESLSGNVGECPLVFRTMEHGHKSLSQPLYRGFKSRAGDVASDLEGSYLEFAGSSKSRLMYYYFQTCCSVWKQEYLADPECKDQAEFWARFRQHISTLWPARFVDNSIVTDKFKPPAKDEELQHTRSQTSPPDLLDNRAI